MMRQTSLQSHEDIQSDGTAESQRLAILHFLKKFPDGLTRYEISSLMKISINSVCGRIRELIKFGTVYEEGRRKNYHTGKENIILKASQVRE